MSSIENHRLQNLKCHGKKESWLFCQLDCPVRFLNCRQVSQIRGSDCVCVCQDLSCQDNPARGGPFSLISVPMAASFMVDASIF